jgi:hypothetical protein
MAYKAIIGKFNGFAHAQSLSLHIEVAILAQVLALFLPRPRSFSAWRTTFLTWGGEAFAFGGAHVCRVFGDFLRGALHFLAQLGAAGFGLGHNRVSPAADILFPLLGIELFELFALGGSEFRPDAFEHLAFTNQLLIALVLLIGSEIGSMGGPEGERGT